MLSLVLSEAAGTHSATEGLSPLSPLVTAEGCPYQWVLWGQSDSRNSLAKGKPGHPHCKRLSDLELVLEGISLTAWVEVD